MIYSCKPQRSGRSIVANTNNPPQDPPPPPKPIALNDIPKVSDEIPDIPIENTIPPVPELCIKEELSIATTPSTKIIPKQQPQKPIIPKPKQQPQKSKIIPKQQSQKPIIPKRKTTLTEKPQKEIPKISLFKRFLAKIKSIFGK